MGYPRNKRISEEIKKIVSHLIMYDIKDPRIPQMTSVTHVDTTRDLRFTYIYISVLDSKANKDDIIEGLSSAKGFVRKEIGKELKLRYTPEPVFKMDESIENGIYISKLINDVNKNVHHDDDSLDEEEFEDDEYDYENEDENEDDK